MNEGTSIDGLLSFQSKKNWHYWAHNNCGPRDHWRKRTCWSPLHQMRAMNILTNPINIP